MIYAVTFIFNIPINRNHSDTKQRNANIAILNERNDSTEHVTVRPCALYEAKRIERQH